MSRYFTEPNKVIIIYIYFFLIHTNAYIPVCRWRARVVLIGDIRWRINTIVQFKFIFSINKCSGIIENNIITIFDIGAFRFSDQTVASVPVRRKWDVMYNK